MRKAFTMIELVFVVAIIGILASIAIPRFAITRDDAKITSGKSTVAAIRSALANERQLRTLKGDFTPINGLDNDSVASTAISNFSDNQAQAANATLAKTSVLNTIIPVCSVGETGCWQNGTTYLMPGSGTAVNFILASGQFNCDATDTNCQKLTQ